MKDFVAIDIETTGLNHDRDDAIEIALVRFEGGAAAETWSSFVKPEAALRPFIVALTNISPADLEGAPEFSAVADEISKRLGDLPVVAYNAAFDRFFLEKAFAKCGREAPKNEWIDALVLARTAWPRLENHKLETVVAHLELESATAHRASPDAKWAGEVCVKALEAIAAMPEGDRALLGKLAAGSPLARVLPALPAAAGGWKPAKPAFPAVAEAADPGDLPDGESKELSKFLRGVWLEGRIGIAEIPTALAREGLLDAFARILPSSGERWVLVASHHELEKWSSDLRARGVEALVLRKGDRYACRRRLELFSSGPARSLAEDERAQLMPMLSWWNGASPDEEEWAGGTGFNAQRNFQLWQKVCAHPSGCSGELCGEGCPGRAMRALAEDAQVVVVDKELFFRDVQCGLTLLPRWDHIVVLEAEKIPGASVLLLEQNVRFYRLRNVIQRFANPWREGVGLLFAAEELAPGRKEFGALAEALRESERELQKLLSHVGLYARKQKVMGDMGYGKPLTQLGAASLQEIHAALDAADARAAECDAAAAELAAGERWFALLRPEFGILRQELRDFRNSLDTLVEARNPQLLYWANEWANPHHISLHGAPRNPGAQIGGALNRWARSICWIGAPLAVSRYLDRFLDSIGTRPSDRLVDFQHMRPKAPPALLCSGAVRDDTTQPDQKEQMRLLSLLEPKVKGRIVVLLTHERLISSWLSDALAAFPDRLVVAEGTDGALPQLWNNVRGAENAMILATDWPSDLPCGEDDLLVIPRIPFPQGRSSYLEQLAGSVTRRRGNAFQEVYVPEAALILRRWLDAHPVTPRAVLDPRAVGSRYAKKLSVLWGRDATIADSDEKVLAWASRPAPAEGAER